MITVACVLRSGGIYTPAWVERLSAGVRRHLPLPYRFVCLSDDASLCIPGVERLPLPPTASPGWWSKLELFRPGTFGPGERVLYLDLDSVVVGDLSGLAGYAGACGMIGDFYRPTLSQSGVMAWTANALTAEVWWRWHANPSLVMLRFRGDGDFLAHVLGGREDRLDRLYPGQIVSYKLNCGGRGVPPSARVVAFHGAPKPSALQAGHALRKLWEAA